jgi:hypothetical protein
VPNTIERRILAALRHSRRDLDCKDIETSGNPTVDQFIHGRAEGAIKM